MNYPARPLLLALTLAGLSPLAAAETAPPPDQWLTNQVPSQGTTGKVLGTNQSGHLRAEVIAGRLVIKLDESASGIPPRLRYSAGSPGHWPARDWRTIPMKRSGQNWAAEPAVDSLETPLVYQVTLGEETNLQLTPLRLARPRPLGLEEPSRVFWPFLEGFEQGTEGWTSSPGSKIRVDRSAKNGQAALALPIPEGARAASVETTRLQGWYLEEKFANGFGLWLRTRSGPGTVSFTLVSHARTPEQIITRRPETTTVGEKWQRVDLPWASFPKVRVGDIDLLSIEFTAEAGAVLLLDDLHLLGRWNFD